MIKLKQITVQARDGGNFVGTLEMVRLKVNSEEKLTYRSAGADVTELVNRLLKELERVTQSYVRYGIVKTIIKNSVTYDLEKVEVLGPSHAVGLNIYVDKNGSRFTGNSNDFYMTEEAAREAIETKKLQDQKC